MLVCLGENIRSLRIAKGITQEQLGYEMGVSAQAVSRWENGATYPDITMLPMIADFFDVTLDELMGRGRELETNEREAFFKRVHEMYNRKEILAVLEAYDKMLQKHPNDAYLLHGKVNVLYYSQFKKKQDMSVAKEIISLCNKISCSNNIGMQCGANALLVRVYARTGQLEEARKLANALPSFEVGRELLIAECLQDAEKKEHYRYLVERFEGMVARYKKRLSD
ncbi:MAG: helix-turn-helix transcriptional regulator [Oscillospiraceae bacterium]|nr:helix-turn-helix transcriptional regulator [Oscillospiraceae bacterium]